MEFRGAAPGAGTHAACCLPVTAVVVAPMPAMTPLLAMSVVTTVPMMAIVSATFLRRADQRPGTGAQQGAFQRVPDDGAR